MAENKLDLLKIKAGLISNTLLEDFGQPIWNCTDPLDELILTILSQNTNDRNRDHAYRNMRARFPDWKTVRDAKTEDLVETIRTAGLGNQKANRIQAILRQITLENGSLNVEFLHKMPEQQVKEWLLQFKGVGFKTAAIVMQFSLGMPAFPVDTHVYRVSGRVGLRPAKMNVEKTHTQLEQLFPRSDYGHAHLNLIRLGREICHPRNPVCSTCPVRKFCDYYQLKEIKT